LNLQAVGNAVEFLWYCYSISVVRLWYRCGISVELLWYCCSRYKELFSQTISSFLSTS